MKDLGGIIGEYAKRTGVLLDDGDPIVGISTLLDIAREQDRAALSELLTQLLDQRDAKMADMLKKHAAHVSEAVPQPPITIEEIQTLNRAASKHAAGEVTYAVKALVGRQFWKLSAAGAAGLVAYGLVCGGVGAVVQRSVTPAPPVLTCQDERGGRVCYTWIAPPTQPEPAPVQAAPKPTGKR